MEIGSVTIFAINSVDSVVHIGHHSNCGIDIQNNTRDIIPGVEVEPED